MNSTNSYITDESRWKAVLKRDGEAHDAFVYAVTTTGVYCRPTCPSRRPLRENVVFFEAASTAETNGFRPCRRCRPDRQPASAPADPRIIEACRILAEAGEPPTLNELAARFGLSPSYFHKLFKKNVGITPKEFGADCRLQRMRENLKNGSGVTEALYQAGYGSSSRLYEITDSRLGMTPAVFKNGGGGEVIVYAVGRSFLGPVLVAATERGICTVAFGDSASELIDGLKKDFPKADLREGGRDFAGLVEKVVSFIKAPEQGLGIPLDIQGTAFQQRVWKALRQIPLGTVTSYAELAEQVGRPKSARAVARACATNRIAVAIPCHRVVRSDGGLAGYRWGLARKKALIENEKKTGRD